MTAEEITLPPNKDAWIELLKTDIEAFNAAHAAWRQKNRWQKLDLSGADLRDADLRGAYLQGADLQGAYLRGATFDSQTQVKLVRERGGMLSTKPEIKLLTDRELAELEAIKAAREAKKATASAESGASTATSAATTEIPKLATEEHDKNLQSLFEGKASEPIMTNDGNVRNDPNSLIQGLTAEREAKGVGNSRAATNALNSPLQHG
jgi:hypothetical protein